VGSGDWELGTGNWELGMEERNEKTMRGQREMVAYIMSLCMYGRENILEGKHKGRGGREEEQRCNREQPAMYILEDGRGG
jgi:hypothetical protein